MKKLVFLLFFLLISPIANCAAPTSSYEDKPDIIGFRDMRWGDPISKYASEMIEYRIPYTPNGERILVPMRHYVRINENRQFGEATVEGIEYLFLNDKLVGVVIFTNTSYSDWFRVVEFFAAIYDEEPERHRWQRKSGYISTNYVYSKNPRIGRGFIGFTSDPSLR